jgi:hypothetical protein
LSGERGSARSTRSRSRTGPRERSTAPMRSVAVSR